MTKTLIAAAITAALAAPLGVSADDNATTWPDKAKPTKQSAEQKARRSSRADEAMSGNSAAASGGTRPSYDAPVKPTPPEKAPAVVPSQSSSERTADQNPLQQDKPTGE